MGAKHSKQKETISQLRKELEELKANSPPRRTEPDTDASIEIRVKQEIEKIRKELELKHEVAPEDPVAPEPAKALDATTKQLENPEVEPLLKLSEPLTYPAMPPRQERKPDEQVLESDPVPMSTPEDNLETVPNAIENEEEETSDKFHRPAPKTSPTRRRIEEDDVQPEWLEKEYRTSNQVATCQNALMCMIFEPISALSFILPGATELRLPSPKRIGDSKGDSATVSMETVSSHDWLNTPLYGPPADSTNNPRSQAPGYVPLYARRGANPGESAISENSLLSAYLNSQTLDNRFNDYKVGTRRSDNLGVGTPQVQFAESPGSGEVASLKPSTVSVHPREYRNLAPLSRHFSKKRSAPELSQLPLASSDSVDSQTASGAPPSRKDDTAEGLPSSIPVANPTVLATVLVTEKDKDSDNSIRPATYYQLGPKSVLIDDPTNLHASHREESISVIGSNNVSHHHQHHSHQHHHHHNHHHHGNPHLGEKEEKLHERPNPSTLQNDRSAIENDTSVAITTKENLTIPITTVQSERPALIEKANDDAVPPLSLQRESSPKERAILTGSVVMASSIVENVESVSAETTPIQKPPLQPSKSKKSVEVISFDPAQDSSQRLRSLRVQTNSPDASETPKSDRMSSPRDGLVDGIMPVPDSLEPSPISSARSNFEYTSDVSIPSDSAASERISRKITKRTVETISYDPAFGSPRGAKHSPTFQIRRGTAEISMTPRSDVSQSSTEGVVGAIAPKLGPGSTEEVTSSSTLRQPIDGLINKATSITADSQSAGDSGPCNLHQDIAQESPSTTTSVDKDSPLDIVGEPNSLHQDISQGGPSTATSVASDSSLHQVIAEKKRRPQPVSNYQSMRTDPPPPTVPAEILRTTRVISTPPTGRSSTRVTAKPNLEYEVGSVFVSNNAIPVSDTVAHSQAINSIVIPDSSAKAISIDLPEREEFDEIEPTPSLIIATNIRNKSPYSKRHISSVPPARPTNTMPVPVEVSITSLGANHHDIGNDANCLSEPTSGIFSSVSELKSPAQVYDKSTGANNLSPTDSQSGNASSAITVVPKVEKDISSDRSSISRTGVAPVTEESSMPRMQGQQALNMRISKKAGNRVPDTRTEDDLIRANILGKVPYSRRRISLEPERDNVRIPLSNGSRAYSTDRIVRYSSRLTPESLVSSGVTPNRAQSNPHAYPQPISIRRIPTYELENLAVRTGDDGLDGSGGFLENPGYIENEMIYNGNPPPSPKLSSGEQVHYPSVIYLYVSVKRVPGGSLGLKLGDVVIKSTKGQQIARVRILGFSQPHGQAAVEAGLQANDWICGVNGQFASRPADLIQLMQSTAETITFRILRNSI